MKRRKFLKYTAPLAATPMVLGGLPLQSFATPRMLMTLNCTDAEERALVMIRLNGGNDGLNTIIPIQQYSSYANLRPDIRINENQLLTLDDNTNLDDADKIGINPGMTALRDLYNDGKVNIIQGVSYANQNKSHFKSTDLWMTGGDGTDTSNSIQTGWMGRYLNARFPGVAASPTTLMPDPLGIQFGSSKPSLGFHTSSEHAMAINLRNHDVSGYYNSVSEIGGAKVNNVPNGDFGDGLNYIMNIENSVSNYAGRIDSVFEIGRTTNVTYPDSSLAKQLKTVARLVDGGCKTKIYLVSLGGFDTHNLQVISGATNTGKHHDLLKNLFDSIKAFQEDLQGFGISDKVMTVTFSEFGRKAEQNGNFGTDHGTLAPMFVIGDAVKKGVTGTNVDLVNLASNSQLQGMQYDYRQVYATLLQDWMGAGESLLNAAYFNSYAGAMKLDLINPTFKVNESCYTVNQLPINLTYFRAKSVDNQSVELDWSTDSEVNNNYFEVERSKDGKQFQGIEKIASKGGFNKKTNYQTFDQKPFTGISYYRLKQVDYSGKINYTVIQKVVISSPLIKGLKLYPNPVIFDANLVLTASQTYNARISIFSINGQQISNTPIQIDEGFNKINLDLKHLSKGSYQLILESNIKQLKQAVGFIKQ